VTLSAVACLATLPHWSRDVAATRIVCESCGHKSTKYTAGDQPSVPHGEKITLTLHDGSDLNREFLKSKFCRVTIDYLGLTLEPEANSGYLCTIREMLEHVKQDVISRYSQVVTEKGIDEQVTAIQEFIEKITQLLNVQAVSRNETSITKNLFIEAGLCTSDNPITIVCDDPAGNTYIQPLSVPIETDAAIKMEQYPRTKEIIKEFGFDD
jgi:C4-type Zn-finger protein